MANVEGAIRMKQVGKFFVLGGLASTVLAAIMLFAQQYLRMSEQAYHSPVLLPRLPMIALLMMPYLGIFPMIIGSCLWASGWIVEGFLTPQRPD